MKFYTTRTAFLFTVIFTLMVVFPGPSVAQNLRIYHIDVEQADATLFIAPSGRTLLVDSGKNGHGTRIKAIMDQAGVPQIDHLVTTHYHEDHFGGIDDLVKDFQITVGQVYDRGDKSFLSATKRNQKTYKDYEAAVGHRATHLTRGETIILDPTMSVTCISSGGVVLGEDPPTAGTHENDLSISLLVQYQGFRYFIGGDIEATTEEKIAERDLVLDVDVYQANHHGSHTSSSPLFLQDLRPSVVIISSGNDGLYQHPRQETLNHLKELNPPPTVFQLNKYLKGGKGGNVEDAFIADLESTDTDGTILMTVDPLAGSYLVSYRDTQSHTFTIRGGQSPTGTVVITHVLPNPVGSDSQGESVTLRNDGPASINLAGWVLRDASNKIWTLSSLGILDAGKSGTIQRKGMPMSLNNNGDTIELIDPNNKMHDQFSYSDSTEGVSIATGR